MTDQSPAVYDTVFRVGFLDLLLNLLWLLIPIAFLVGGFEYISKKPPKSYLPAAPPSREIQSPFFRKLLGALLILLSLAMAWAIARVTFVDFLDLRAGLKNGRYHVIEGPVENFVPMPYQGHAVERFTVNGIPFSYSTYEVTNCFNHTSSHGGPVRAGLQVRVSYVGGHPGLGSNCILKLEIAKPPSR